MPTHTYKPKEKLKGKTASALLFKSGKSLFVFPLRITYIYTNNATDHCLKAGVGTSKRLFKKATDRNYIKRILREGWRKEKEILSNTLAQQNKRLLVFIQYTDKALPNAANIQQRIKIGISRLLDTIEKNEDRI